MQGFKHIGQKFKGHRICATFPGKGPEPIRAPGSFLIYAEEAREKVGSFSSLFAVENLDTQMRS